MTSLLSDYEKRRAENIERNNARLQELGLISRDEQERSDAKAWGRPNDDETTKENATDGSNTSKQKKKRSRQQGPLAEPSRKSRRLQREQAELAAIDLDEVDEAWYAPPEDKSERQARVEECRLARQRAAVEIAKAGGGKQSKNPSATYDHCLMRVKTMTDKALANRVKAIERATGKHCVVKMAIFKSCLQDENMWDLAKLASEALERLKALQPPPLE